MYARRLRLRGWQWNGVDKCCKLSGLCSQPQCRGGRFVREFGSAELQRRNRLGFVSFERISAGEPCCSSRFYSSKGEGSNPSDGNRQPVVDKAGFAKSDSEKSGLGSCTMSSLQLEQHARLGECEQKAWLNWERFLMECRKKESPLLSKRQRFKNEFLRRLVPWDKIDLSWRNFPYYLNESTKKILEECTASHIRHRTHALSYGSRLASSGGRILLQSMPGTELYRERLIRALAHELRVPLLVLDSLVLAPHDFSQEYVSEDETDDDDAESQECSDSEDEHGDATSADEWSSANDTKSSDSDVEDAAVTSTKALRKLRPRIIEELAKRVISECEDASMSEPSETARPTEQAKRPFQRGDRVKYVGASVVVEDDQRIILGKIPTPDGSTNAFTFINGRILSNGQRGEVFEINGDQVAVIFDAPPEKVVNNANHNKAIEPLPEPSLYWVDVQDISHDTDCQAEDWYIAIEALCELLPSLQPIIVYFPDSPQWLSRAVPKSKHAEFLEKVAEMFDRLEGPVVFICGQNIMEDTPKGKDKITMFLPQLGRVSQLPLPLQRFADGLNGTKDLKSIDLTKLFTNTIQIPLPREEQQLKTLNSQIEEDRKLIISRHNLPELRKVLEDHQLSCSDILHLKVDDVILNRQKAEKVVGWARNHYLSSVMTPHIKSDRLMIPHASLDMAISRLREQQNISTKPQNLKSLVKDEYESNFVSAVVPPEEIGVKFDDIGALEDVKKTLDELVTLPMRRPELFLHGNLLRPCKGILLFGPPGTGKTLLAKALATEAGANFISITGSSLTSKWFGDAEKLTKALFSFASRLAPVIIFVDEVDSLLGARGGASEHEATRRMRNEFMAAWDGLKSKDSQRILILAATNRPFDLDDAVIRRLPRRIYVDLPDAKNRMKILKILLAKENIEPNFGFEELANLTEGYSGSDLKNLCIAAAYRPVQELLEEEKKVGITSSSSALRHLKLDDFLQAKAKVGCSVAYDALSMHELRKWNEQYGEDGSRRRSPFGFGR